MKIFITIVCFIPLFFWWYCIWAFKMDPGIQIGFSVLFGAISGHLAARVWFS